MVANFHLITSPGISKRGWHTPAGSNICHIYYIMEVQFDDNKFYIKLRQRSVFFFKFQTQWCRLFLDKLGILCYSILNVNKEFSFGC
jgi:hypothetical protein